MLTPPDLLEAVKAYADANMNLGKAADKLFICRNSLIYRLRLAGEHFKFNPRNFYELAEFISKRKEEIKCHAIKMILREVTAKELVFYHILEKNECMGFNISTPYAYVLCHTNEQRDKVFEEISKYFDFCEIVEEEMYVKKDSSRPNPWADG